LGPNAGEFEPGSGMQESVIAQPMEASGQGVLEVTPDVLHPIPPLIVRQKKFAHSGLIRRFHLMLTEEIRRLSRSEKLLLINDLWDDLAVDEADQPLSHEQEKMLDERYEQFVADPAQGKPWSEVRKELSEKL